MKIYDSDLNLEITNPDLEKGYLKEAQRFVAHHEEEPEEHHTEVMEDTISELCPYGLQQVIVDKPHRAAWDEYETVQMYVPFEKDSSSDDAVAAKLDRIDAQITFTALMTDTLIPNGMGV